MKEIKFRWWHKENKVMEWDYLKSNSYYQNPFSRIDLITMQFTGLLDKQGKEIYEGDVVKLKDYKPIEVKIPEIFVFNFDDGDFADGSEYEIIGNIYENPELL